MTVGMKIVRSCLNQAETVARIEHEVGQQNMKLVTQIDHAEAARQAGLVLDPTCLLIVGNPAGGTPLMQDCQTAGIDLPLKILVWTDRAAVTWVGYNAPCWIASRHCLSQPAEQIVQKMATALALIVKVVIA